MKWLQGTSRNIRHGFTEDEKDIETVIELVVVFSETKSRMISNKIVRVDAVSDFRVCMTASRPRPSRPTEQRKRFQRFSSLNIRTPWERGSEPLQSRRAARREK
jgi:hypothetical protein